MLRTTLDAYGRLDREAAQARGIDPMAWQEEEQRSDANNPYLLHGLLEAMESSCPTNGRGELGEFKRLLKAQGIR